MFKRIMRFLPVIFALGVIFAAPAGFRGASARAANAELKIPRADEWGFGVTVSAENAPTVEKLVGEFRENGINQLRLTIDWARFNPQPKEFPVDEAAKKLLGSARREGLGISALVGIEPPAWVPDRPNKTAYWFAVPYFVEFVGRTVKNFDMMIEHYEIGDDPLPVQDYIDILRAGALTIRKEHPEATVLNGPFTWRHAYGSARGFNMGGTALSGLFKSGLYYFDALSWRMTELDNGEVRARRLMNRVLEASRTFGLGDYALEVRVTLPPWAAESARSESAREQASRIVRTVCALHAATPADVRLTVFWPRLIDEDAKGGAGLWDRSMKPKPALKAVAVMMQMLSSAFHVGAVPAPKGVRAELFLKDGVGVVVAWGEGELALPLAKGARSVSMMGETAELQPGAKASLKLTGDPVYVTGLEEAFVRRTFARAGKKMVAAGRETFKNAALMKKSRASLAPRFEKLFARADALFESTAAAGAESGKLRDECTKLIPEALRLTEAVIDERRAYRMKKLQAMKFLDLMRLARLAGELSGFLAQGAPDAAAADPLRRGEVEDALDAVELLLKSVLKDVTPTTRSPKLEAIHRFFSERLISAKWLAEAGKVALAAETAAHMRASMSVMDKLADIDKPSETRVWAAFDPYRVVVNRLDTEQVKVSIRNEGLENPHVTMTLKCARGWQLNPVTVVFDRDPGSRMFRRFLIKPNVELEPGSYDFTLDAYMNLEDMPANSFGAEVTDICSANLERIPKPFTAQSEIKVRLVNRSEHESTGPVLVSVGVPGTDWRFAPAYRLVASLPPLAQKIVAFRPVRAPANPERSFTLIGFVRDLKGQTLECRRRLSALTKESLAAAKTAEGSSLVATGPWFIAGPFDSPLSADPRVICKAFDEDFLSPAGGEKKADPSAAGGKIPWKKVNPTSHVDFKAVLGATTNKIAYAFTTVEVAEDSFVAVEAGSADGMKLFLDGKLIVERRVRRTARPADDCLFLRLEKGRHRILAKVFTMGPNWELYLRLVRPAGEK